MARNRWDDKQIEVLKGLIARNLSLERFPRDMVR